MAIIGKDLNAVVQYLQDGDVVAIPTETVYGLAGNALDEKAVRKIYQVKGRPNYNPLIIHTNSLEKVRNWVKDISDTALKLAEVFWPGPLTLVLPKEAIIPDLVTSGHSTVAIRIPSHPLTLSLLEKLDFPLAAPSANPFGFISPTSPEHVNRQLGENLAYILDGGPCSVGLESTIILPLYDSVKILRYGGISVEEIKKVIKKIELPSEHEFQPLVPGQLKSHYASKHPLLLGNLNNLKKEVAVVPEKTGVIAFQRFLPGIPEVNQVILSPSGNYAEAASKLFSALRELDDMDIEVILAEEFPYEDLGASINDRLKRASKNA